MTSCMENIIQQYEKQALCEGHFGTGTDFTYDMRTDKASAYNWLTRRQISGATNENGNHLNCHVTLSPTRSDKCRMSACHSISQASTDNVLYLVTFSLVVWTPNQSRTSSCGTGVFNSFSFGTSGPLLFELLGIKKKEILLLLLLYHHC